MSSQGKDKKRSKNMKVETHKMLNICVMQNNTW